MPLPPGDEEEKTSEENAEPKLQFSYVECLIFTFHQLAKKVISVYSSTTLYAQFWGECFPCTCSVINGIYLIMFHCCADKMYPLGEDSFFSSSHKEILSLSRCSLIREQNN